MRPFGVLALVACLGPVGLLAQPATAGASESVHLVASFTPNRPNASSTIVFGFTIAGSGGQVPSPLLGVDLHLPAGIGLARNSLGQAICKPAELYDFGPDACPPNSRLGFGDATAEVPYGPAVVREHASVYAYRGASEEEHVTVLFFTEARAPVFADVVFPGHLLEDSGPFSGQIDTKVPIVPSLPEGPNVSVVQFQSTFGPRGIVYEREVKGETVYFHPHGVTLPRACPRGGYPFAGNFTFEDGTSQTVNAAAPCPRHAGSRTRHS